MSDQNDDPIGLTRIVIRYRKPLYAQVYEKWRRAKGQNPKITLREVCAQMGVSYAAISSAKYRAKKKRQRK